MNSFIQDPLPNGEDPREDIPLLLTYQPTRPEVDDPSLGRLLDMLTYRRPHGSRSELEFRRRFILDRFEVKHIDESGNIFVEVGENPTVLWSSHTDTVHTAEGRQSVVIKSGYIELPQSSLSNCLGADDGAGVWLMTEMIEAGVPGLYVFHYGEERGCIGSRYIADETPGVLQDINCAVAFDRRGFLDVITHQMTGRCCSDEFARSLAQQLPQGYRPSQNGVYTDTAQYIDLVPECTNVAVGYFSEHTSGECLNVDHILDLRDHLVAIDMSRVPIVRDPTAVDAEAYGDWTRYLYHSNDDGYAGYGMTYGHTGRKYGRQTRISIPTSMEDLLLDYPTEAAKVLEDYGFTYDEIWDEIEKARS